MSLPQNPSTKKKFVTVKGEQQQQGKNNHNNNTGRKKEAGKPRTRLRKQKRRKERRGKIKIRRSSVGVHLISSLKVASFSKMGNACAGAERKRRRQRVSEQHADVPPQRYQKRKNWQHSTPKISIRIFSLLLFRFSFFSSFFLAWLAISFLFSFPLYRITPLPPRLLLLTRNNTAPPPPPSLPHSSLYAKMYLTL